MNQQIMKAALTWAELNALLRTLRDEKDAKALYDAQKAGGANARWQRRIWGRFAQLRKERERREFLSGGGPYRGPRTPKSKRRKETV
jgi:hypothetical protein